MANNNISGNVLYNVVNIFGDLVGDIILPQSTIDALMCGCDSSNSVANTGNGAGSTSNANSNTVNNNTTGQSNNAVIDNNLTFDATTGDNNSSFNTDGNSTVTTGSSNVSANVLNIANSNIAGGTWWLVIVNEAGHWIGKIMGSPDGATMAGSAGTEFEVDPVTGAVSAVNSGNGAGSNNTTNSNTTNNNTTTQSNDAHIQNNINLSANTGGNKSSYNTGGSSNVVTGDANIIANIVNFVNNNVTGGGKLVVTVVNVFGSWLGDFVAPGQQRRNTANNSSNSSNSNTSATTNSNTTTTSTVASATGNATTSTTKVQHYTNKTVAGSVKGSSTTNGGQTNLEATVAKSVGQDGSAAVAKKTINVNIAWLLMALPLFGIAFLAKKSFVPVRTLAVRGIHLFL